MPHNALDMFARAIHFHPDGLVHDEELKMAEDLGSWRLAAFHVETDEDVHADHWEIHPSAEELVRCLSGAMRIRLRPQRPGSEEVIKLTSGTCYIVPRGRWHRIELDEPTNLMSVTLPHDSRLERRAP